MRISKKIQCIQKLLTPGEHKVIDAFIEISDSRIKKAASEIQKYLRRENARLDDHGLPLGVKLSAEQLRKGMALLLEIYAIIFTWRAKSSKNKPLKAQTNAFIDFLVKAFIYFEMADQQCLINDDFEWLITFEPTIELRTVILEEQIREANFAKIPQQLLASEGFRIQQSAKTLVQAKGQLMLLGYTMDAKNFLSFIEIKTKNIRSSEIDQNDQFAALWIELLRLLDPNVCLKPKLRKRHYNKCLRLLPTKQEVQLYDELDVTICLGYALLFHGDFKGWMEVMNEYLPGFKEIANKHVQLQNVYCCLANKTPGLPFLSLTSRITKTNMPLERHDHAFRHLLHLINQKDEPGKIHSSGQYKGDVSWQLAEIALEMATWLNEEEFEMLHAARDRFRKKLSDADLDDEIRSIYKAYSARILKAARHAKRNGTLLGAKPLVPQLNITCPNGKIKARLLDFIETCIIRW